MIFLGFRLFRIERARICDKSSHNKKNYERNFKLKRRRREIFSDQVSKTVPAVKSEIT